MSYLHDICLDEIALEGLDGITPACLWCRLDQRLPKFPLALDPKAKQFLWGGVLTRIEVTFHRLPEPRELPTFPHEYRFTDEATGIISLNEQNIRKEYPGCIVNSSENGGIQGSCSTFKDRVDISDEVRGQAGGKAMTLEEVQERWGDSLVLVASQDLRLAALLGPHGDPSLELGDIQYCLLEYVGRMRHHGTNQTDFVRLFNFTSKSMHGYRQTILEFQLVDRRMCWWEMAKKAQNFVVLTLRRFVPFAKHGSMSRFMIVSKLILSFLDSQPEKTAKYNVVFNELRKKLPYVDSTKDLKSCLRKTFQLLQNMEVLKVIYSRAHHGVDSFQLIKIPNEEKDDADEDTSNDYDPANCGLVAELPLAFQIYNVIDNQPGIDYSGIEKHLQLEGRFVQILVDKILLKNKLIKFNVLDEGRQRVRKFHTVETNKGWSPEKDGNEGTHAMASTSAPPNEPVHKQQSLRFLKRREKMLEILRKSRVQLGFRSMLKELRMAEKLEGRVEKCDARSVRRILEKMEQEGLCKVFSTVVMSDDGTMNKSVSFVTDVNVAKDDPIIMHTIQQVKFRMIDVNLTQPKENPPASRKKSKPKGSVAPNKARKPKRKEQKTSKDVRVTEYQTLAQTADKEAEEQQACSTTHDTLWGSKEGDENHDGTEDSSEEQSKRQFILSRGMYGCLQKMERIRVLHRFTWYLVYGMPKHQPVKAPQPDEENKMPTIKQEFGESEQSEIIARLEGFSQGTLTADIPMDSSRLIGQSTDQSERPSAAMDSALNQSGVATGGQDPQAVGVRLSQSTGDAGRDDADQMPLGRELQAQLTTGTSKASSEQTEEANSQSAINLLESIESGLVSDRQPSSTATASTANLTEFKTERCPPSTSGGGAFQFPPLASHKVYLNVMDWRRFMQPLPDYQDIPKGWCYLGDLILSMPLVLFCEVVPVRYMIDGLDDCLKDPMTRLLLIKDLPLNLRRKLLEGRRYLFMLEKEIEKMSSMGLTIYTVHQQECKEMLSLYVCRNVSVVDTTSSNRSSYFVSDKQYPSHKHHLATLNDVEKFWFEMKVICLDTPLGMLRSEPPIKGKPRSKFISFARTLKSKQDPVIDDGRIPGDGRGAGGYDSSFFGHLKRNWTSDTINPHYMSKERFQNRFQRNLDKVKNTPGRLGNRLQHKTISLTTRPGVKEVVSVETKLVDVDRHKAKTAGGKGLKRKRPPAPNKESEKAASKKLREDTIRRREEKKRAKEDRKIHQRQKRAVGIITRTAYTWTPAEDSVLLLCKVASSIFHKVLSYKNLVTWETIEQVFRKKLPNVSNLDKKDAKSISKRSTRLMRYSEYRMNYSVCLGEVYEDQALMDSINPNLDKHSQETIASEYHKLVDKLETKFRIEGIFHTSLPEDMTSLHRDYTVEPIAKVDKTNNMFFKDENLTDLRRLALHTIVLSTLSSQTASDYDARSSFKLYEQYDSNLLHDVFLFCRSKGLVSRSMKNKARRRIVPLVPISYQLSSAYLRLFNMNKMPHELPAEAVACYRALLESAPDEGVIYPQVTCGSCSCQISLILSDQVNCKIIVPKQVIILDSKLIDKDFLEQSGLLKKDVDDSSDSDSDSEDGSVDEEDEEDQRQEIDGGANLDIKGTIEGSGQEMTTGQRGPGVVEVSFEEDGDESGKPKTGARTSGSDSRTTCLEDAEEEMATEENRAMEALCELAGGTSSGNSQPSVRAGPQTPAVGRSSTDLDHSYFPNVQSVPAGNQPSRSGDPERDQQERGSPSKGVVSESGDAPLMNVPQASTREGPPTEPQETNSELVDAAGDASTMLPAPLQTAGSGRSQIKTATMKCLRASQSSFTKWLILQGHYAPGVCGTHISMLQENIAFNAFKIKLAPKPSSSTNENGPQEFHPCCSLSEYLLRPCKSFNPTEAMRKPTELSQEAAYLEEACNGKYIQRKADYLQELSERCTQHGLDGPSTTFILKVYKKIEEAGFLGLTLTEVKRIVGRVIAKTGSTMHPETCINALLQHQMVWEVGSNELRLVSTKHASLWAIQSQRLVDPKHAADTDPRPKRRCLDTPLDEHSTGKSEESMTVDLTMEPSPPDNCGSTSTESRHQRPDLATVAECTPTGSKGQPEVTDLSAAKEPTEVTAERGESTPDRKGSDGDVETAPASGSTSTETGEGRAAKRKLIKAIEGIYEPIEFVPYPWRKVNGEVNRPELFLMMRGIALFIIAEPGIKEARLLVHFKDIFRKVDTLKLLQMMSDLGLITRHCIRLRKPSLFSTTKSRHQPPVYYYLPSVNCLTIMGTLFNHRK